MKRAVSAAILILVCFVLQSSVFRTMSIGGIVPNLMVVLAASYGFMCGERTGMFVGIACGILMDIFFGDYFGIYTLIYMYIGYVNGKFSYVFYPEDVKLPMVLIIVSDLVYGFVCYVCLFLMRGRFHFGYYFIHIILPEVVYTIVVTLLLYPLTLRVNKLVETDKQKGSEKSFV